MFDLVTIGLKFPRSLQSIKVGKMIAVPNFHLTTFRVEQSDGEEMAESTPFWIEALNDILAGGQQVF